MLKVNFPPSWTQALIKKEVIIIFRQINSKFIKTIQSDNLYCQVRFNTYYEIKPLKYL